MVMIMNMDYKDFFDILENSRSSEPVRSRNYRCPKCSGEFNSWDIGDGYPRKYLCPFCGSVRNEYDNEEDEKFLEDRDLDEAQEQRLKEWISDNEDELYEAFGDLFNLFGLDIYPEGIESIDEYSIETELNKALEDIAEGEFDEN